MTQKVEILIICRGPHGSGKSIAIEEMVAGLNAQGTFVNVLRSRSHFLDDLEIVSVFATLKRTEHE